MKALSSNTLDSTSSLELSLDPSLPIFTGHFPGNPVYPAFLQLRWVRASYERLYSRSGHIQFFQVKFLKPVTPGETMRLVFTSVSDEVMRFVVSTEKGEATKGKICMTESE